MLAKKFGFGFGIAILLPMVIHYGVSTFSPQPKWRDYHDNGYYNNYKDATPEEKKALEEKRRKIDNEFRAKQKTFERRLFYVAAPTGIAAIAIGSLLSVQAIGAGLIFGGIFTLVDGYGCYWSELQDWMRFLSLLVAFIVIVCIGYLKMKDKPDDRATEAVHPLVRSHPETKRKSLYISVHTETLEGFDEAEADIIIDQLREHAMKPEFVCRFHWKVGSIALWDNRCTQHYAMGDYQGFRRRMQRLMIKGDTPF